MYLFLDDIRHPKDAFLHDEMKYLMNYTGIPNGSWEIVRTYDEFVNIIEERGLPEVVAFDCDLHQEHMRHYVRDSINSGVYEWENFKTKCGVHCANYLKSKIPVGSDIKVVVHSANHIGRRIIKDIFHDCLM